MHTMKVRDLFLFVAMWHDICTCTYTHKDLIQSGYTIYYPTIYISKSINISIYSYLSICGHILTTNIYWNAQNHTDCFTSGVFTVAPREKWWYPGNIVVVMRSMMGISCILYIYNWYTGYNWLLVSGFRSRQTVNGDRQIPRNDFLK